MANGKKGDSALSDLLHWGGEVFHPKIDELIRQLHSVGGLDDPLAMAFVELQADVWQRFDQLYPSDDAALLEQRRRHHLRLFAMRLAYQLRGHQRGHRAGR